MHYYKFNIPAWVLSTAHLSLEEEACYLRLINHYYDTESPIPLETQQVFRRLRMGSTSDTAQAILDEFFDKGEKGYTHKKCDELLKEYRKTAKRSKENGAKGGRPKKDAASSVSQNKPSGFPDETHSEPKHNLNQELLTKNYKPVTSNQEPLVKNTIVSTEVDTSEPVKKKTKYVFDDQHLELAKRMANPVKKRFETMKIDHEQWADAVRRLEQLDSRPIDQIISVWAWIVKHEEPGFSWADNIRTPMKLRQRDKQGVMYYEVIWQKMASEGRHIGGGEIKQFSAKTEQNIKTIEGWANGSN